MSVSKIPIISDQALTRAIIACFACLPIGVIVLLIGVFSVDSGITPFIAVFWRACLAMALSLVLGPIAAVIFHKLGWRRATWLSIASPAVLFLLVLGLSALSAGAGVR